jgi:hypothetical protein
MQHIFKIATFVLRVVAPSQAHFYSKEQTESNSVGTMEEVSPKIDG